LGGCFQVTMVYGVKNSRSGLSEMTRKEKFLQLVSYGSSIVAFEISILNSALLPSAFYIWRLLIALQTSIVYRAIEHWHPLRFVRGCHRIGRSTALENIILLFSVLYTFPRYLTYRRRHRWQGPEKIMTIDRCRSNHKMIIFLSSLTSLFESACDFTWS
jgi:hypothetical protein